MATLFVLLQLAHFFTAALSALELRQHLMMWKVFAPRFDFDDVLRMYTYMR